MNENKTFWDKKRKLICDVTCDAVYDRFYETGRVWAFSCAYDPERDYKIGDNVIKPHIFWDSDVAKWIEGAAYILADHPERTDLTEKIESIIDDIEKNRLPDGYFNSYFIAVEPGKRFTQRHSHELYCAGHLMEAAVAYYKVTGRKRFLSIMCDFADEIEKAFIKEKSALFFTPGHPEIELALIKLYEATGEKRYLDLSRHFIDERGKHPDIERNDRGAQDHVPCREETTAEGHAVRQLYLNCAMADLARIDCDREMADACLAVYRDIAYRKMCITGAVGARWAQDGGLHEAFSPLPFYLPNETAYNETCASIALAMFCSRLLRVFPYGEIADTAERAIYNGALAGVSLSGNEFFYTNPLSINRKLRGIVSKTDNLPITQRVKVFECSCCPPNILRFISSIEQYAYHMDDETVYIDQFIPFEHDGIKVKTEFPLRSEIEISNKTQKKLVIRIPSYADAFELNVPYTAEHGYAYISTECENVKLKLTYSPKWYEARPEVAEDAGRVAMVCGPFVYCAEAQDNGGDIINLYADTGASITKIENGELNLPEIRTLGYRMPSADTLYRPVPQKKNRTELRLIPYFAYANRGEDDMAVWLLKA